MLRYARVESETVADDGRHNGDHAGQNEDEQLIGPELADLLVDLLDLLVERDFHSRRFVSPPHFFAEHPQIALPNRLDSTPR